MKRFFAIVFSLLLCILGSGCTGKNAPSSAQPTGSQGSVSEEIGSNAASAPKTSSDAEPLRLCVDLERGPELYPSEVAAAVEGFLQIVRDQGGPEAVEVEYIPGSGSERPAALTRVRNELMAGIGPDVFLVITGFDNPNFPDDDPVFLFPEKAMEAGFFLPLDDYLKSARFLEWDKLTPQVMEAGKNDRGQLLLPLCYTFPATFYPRDQVEPVTSGETTWEDMVNDQTGILADAGNGWYAISQGYFVISPWDLFPGSVLGKAEDYEAEQLLYTQEELLEYAKQAVALDQRKQAGEFDSLPEHQTVPMAVGCSNMGDYTIVPCYRKDGGVTATITAFAGVNANTQQPENAFFLLDVLLSKELQKSSELYRYFLGQKNGIPTYEGIMTLEQPGPGGWYMTDRTYQEFSKVREQITATRFSTLLDSELTLMLSDCLHAAEEGENTEKKMEQIVSETYRKLKLYLSES